jgi:hypothetical protein
MLALLSALVVAQVPAQPTSVEVVRPQEVRPLPGQLDRVPVFNSNSPELVFQEGILLSTLAPQGKTHPKAHLNYSFNGRFDLFLHHVAKPPTPEDLRPLYLGVVFHNPSLRPVRLSLLEGATFLSQPDAPFVARPDLQEDPLGTVYAGPGSRVGNDLLRGRRNPMLPSDLTLAPGATELFLALPIPVGQLQPPLNGRSALLRMSSNGPVQVASLARFGSLNAQGQSQPPDRQGWLSLLQDGSLATPRDVTPSNPKEPGPLVYGRVAGVAEGSRWRALVTDPKQLFLAVPAPGQAFSYPISSLRGGRMGTGQNQTAQMLVRYPDTAYEAHGNYAIEYDLTLPLKNTSNETQQVAIALETPLKEDRLSKGGLRFLSPPARPVFFRGTVRLTYRDDVGRPEIRYYHLVQRRGQMGEPLVTLTLPPNDQRSVNVRLIYPADATPPQVLTVKSLPLP